MPYPVERVLMIADRRQRLSPMGKTIPRTITSLMVSTTMSERSRRSSLSPQLMHSRKSRSKRICMKLTRGVSAAP